MAFVARSIYLDLIDRRGRDGREFLPECNFGLLGSWSSPWPARFRD